MILYEKDWDYFPEAVIDDTSPNRSFLNYSLLLKEMGVKNYLWPLSLLNPELKGKDPFDPNLSMEEKISFSVEFKLNPWSYFRMAARAPGSSIERPIYFRADRSNMSMLWLYFNHVTCIIIKPRQTGKTFGFNSLDCYLLNIGTEGGRFLLYTKDEKLRDTTVTELKTIEELLPEYLKQHSKHDIGNREHIAVRSLDNDYKAILARIDPIAADKLARGHKIDNIRIDEFAYLYNVGISLPVILAATRAQRSIAHERGIPYGNIIVSTAGKKDNRDGAYAYKYVTDSAPWTEFLIDSKDQEELYQAIKGSSRDNKYVRVNCTFNHRQLGYTDSWLREAAAETNSEGEAFERDYLNIWTSGSQYSPFTAETSARIRGSEKEIKYAEISRFGQIVIRWYLKEDEISRYMQNEYTAIAVDTSDAIGKDEIAINIRSLRTGDTLAACGINQINLITVANFLVDILMRFDKSTMIIERRNQAATIIDYMHKQMIAKNMDPFRRMYNTCVQDYVEYPERYKEIQSQYNYKNENFLAIMKKYFGFTTSGSGTTARSELYGTVLQQAVKYTGHVVNDKITIDQILSLTIRNGRVDHPPGGHDDLCVAWLLTYWFMTMGKNLQYYGIPHGYVLSHNQIINSSSNKEEQYQQELSQRIKKRIDYLTDTLKQEKDPLVVERLIHEIKNTSSLLGSDHEIAISVDEMLQNLKKEKITNYRNKFSIFR